MNPRQTIAALSQGMTSLGDQALSSLLDDPRKGVQRIVARELRRRERARADKQRVEGMLLHERRYWAEGLLVGGVDEVGVGPLAGPVVAAAVALPPHCSLAGIDDSKRLGRVQREELAQEIKARAAAWSLGRCEPEEIDRLNTFHAAREAMRRAVVSLSLRVDRLLVDARLIPGVSIEQHAIVRGDSQSQSIAAASIVAKVSRDAMMREAAKIYPGYGFDSHKGYYCRQHMRALERLGPCRLHRRSFAPVAMFCVAVGTVSNGAHVDSAAHLGVPPESPR